MDPKRVGAKTIVHSAYLTLVDLTAYLGEGIVADCIEEEFLASSKLALVPPSIVVVFCAKLESNRKMYHLDKLSKNRFMINSLHLRISA